MSEWDIIFTFWVAFLVCVIAGLVFEHIMYKNFVQDAIDRETEEVKRLMQSEEEN